MQIYDKYSPKKVINSKLTGVRNDKTGDFALPADIVEKTADSISSAVETPFPSGAEKQTSPKFQRIKDYFRNFWTDFTEKDIKPYDDDVLPNAVDGKDQYVSSLRNIKYALMAVFGTAASLTAHLIKFAVKGVKKLISAKETTEQTEGKEEKNHLHKVKNFFIAAKEEVKEVFSLEPQSPDDRDSKVKRLAKKLLSYCELRPNSQGEDFKKTSYLTGITTALLSGGAYSRIIPGVASVMPGIASILPGIAVAVAGSLVGITVEKKTKSFYKGIAAAVVSGGALGCAVGAFVGGPVGAAIGGLLGALTSAFGTVESNKFASIRDGSYGGYALGLPFRLLSAGNPLDDLGAAVAGGLGGRALKTKKGKIALGTASGILAGLLIGLVSPYTTVLGSVIRCALAGSLGSIYYSMQKHAKNNVASDFKEKLEALKDK